MDFAAELNAMRANFAASKNVKKDQYVRPSFVKPGNVRNVIYDQMKQLYEQGSVVWSYIVMANELLFQYSMVQGNAGIMYTYCGHPSIDANPDPLRQVANAINGLRSTPLEALPPEMRQLAYSVQSEVTPIYNYPLTTKQMDGVQFFCSSSILQRSMLPHTYIENMLVPYIAAPHLQHPGVMLPCRYWSAGYAAYFSKNRQV